MCVGCLYNGAHRPPYSLPQDRTKSTLRTQSTPDAAGYNELTFDDAAGAERVFVRAQRDLDAVVLRNSSTEIGASETRSIGGSRHTHVGSDDVAHVRRDEIRRTDGAQELHVGGSVALHVGGGPAKGEAAVAMPGMSIEVIAGGYSLSAPQRIELRCGASTIVMTPTSIDIAAPGTTTVRCGGASVALSPAALGMLAPVLSIAAPGASLGLGSSASLRCRARGPNSSKKLSRHWVVRSTLIHNRRLQWPSIGYTTVRYLWPRCQSTSSTPIARIPVRSRFARPQATARLAARKTVSHFVWNDAATCVQLIRFAQPARNHAYAVVIGLLPSAHGTRSRVTPHRRQSTRRIA